MQEISQRHSTDGREPRALVKEFSFPYWTVRVVNEDRASNIIPPNWFHMMHEWMNEFLLNEN